MSRLETNSELIEELIASVRSVAPVATASVPEEASAATLAADKRRGPMWEDSGDYTRFLVMWARRPSYDVITQVIVDELKRRRGLGAYGIRVKTRSSAIASSHANVHALVPRQLSPPSIAKPEAA